MVTCSSSKMGLIEKQSGNVKVMLAGFSERMDVSGGDSFEVPANSTFNIKVLNVADYCFSFIDQRFNTAAWLFTPPRRY